MTCVWWQDQASLSLCLSPSPGDASCYIASRRTACAQDRTWQRSLPTCMLQNPVGCFPCLPFPDFRQEYGTDVSPRRQKQYSSLRLETFKATVPQIDCCKHSVMQRESISPRWIAVAPKQCSFRAISAHVAFAPPPPSPRS